MCIRVSLTYVNTRLKRSGQVKTRDKEYQRSIRNCSDRIKFSVPVHCVCMGCACGCACVYIRARACVSSLSQSTDYIRHRDVLNASSYR